MCYTIFSALFSYISHIAVIAKTLETYCNYYLVHTLGMEYWPIQFIDMGGSPGELSEELVT